jgi:hypothetical protein
MVIERLLLAYLLVAPSILANPIIHRRAVVTNGDVEPWMDTNYQRRSRITILSSQIASTMTDAVLCVDLSDMPSTFHDNVRSDGYDQRASTDDKTTELKIQPEDYDDSGDTGHTWIYVGTLSSSVDTDIYLYYDYPSAANPSDQQDLWDDSGADYMGVWHMDDYALLPQDNWATSGGHLHADDFNLEGGDTIDGKVGKCIDYDGSNEYNAIPTTDSEAYDMRPSDTSFTAMCWFQADDFTDGVLFHHGASTNQGYGLWIWGGDLRPSLGNGGNVWSNMTYSTGILSTGTWYHYAFTWDGSNARGYLDGAEIANSPETETGSWATWANQPFYIGRRETSGYYHGKVDELRVHDDAFSGNTIAWIHQNQDDPGSTYTVRAEETQ